MNVIALFFQIFLLFFGLSGCGNKARRNKKDEPVTFGVRIKGVECAECAKNAMRLLKTIPEIKDLSFIAPPDDFTKGAYHFKVVGSQIPLRQIMDAVEKEGFELSEMAGIFIGRLTPLQTSRSLQFTIDEWPYGFTVRCSENKMVDLFNKFIVGRASPVMSGTLRFDKRFSLYEFIPIS